MSGDVVVGVDVGGTFTDVVVVTETDGLISSKVSSTDEQSIGVIRGVTKACELAGIEPRDIDEFVHGMTVATNALLEGTGAKAALVTTRGFRDVLEIGRQNRPALYDLNASKPLPLVRRSHRFSVAERTKPTGIEQTVDVTEAESLVSDLRDLEVESVAVVFLHSYADPSNERTVGELLRNELSIPVSLSSEVLPEFREYERTATTAADAYVRPVINEYLRRLVDSGAELGLPEPRIMQSNGGIGSVATVNARPVTTVLSGPAAGVVGAGLGAEPHVDDPDFDGMITLDMGGTSSDVSLLTDGTTERTTDMEVGGIPIRLPMVDVTTVGAGGGSIAWLDKGGALRVGPRSSGSNPGPVCYGRGGQEPTVTDAALVLGFLGDDTPLGGELRLDNEAAVEALQRLAETAGLDDAVEAASGIYRIANAKMTRAIRRVTVERGHDPRRFALVAYGGAGPMHAAALAAGLGIARIVIPRRCGVLSALGLVGADEKHDAVRTYIAPTGQADPAVMEEIISDLKIAVSETLRVNATPRIELSADLRYAGQSFEIEVPIERPIEPKAVANRFHGDHEQIYGYRMDETVEFVNLRASAVLDRDLPALAYRPDSERPIGERRVRFPDGSRSTIIYARRSLPVGESIPGPAILEETESTVIIPPDWVAQVAPDGAVIISREDGPP